MAISKKLRFEIFKRDGFTCQYCGKTPPEAILETDHIIPIAEGGTDDINNLITSCFACNRGKAKIPLDKLPPTLKDNLDVIKEQRQQMQLYRKYIDEIEFGKEQDIVEIGYHFFNYFAKTKKSRDKYVFGEKWKSSIKLFLKTFHKYQIRDAIDIAFSRLSRKSYGLNEASLFKYMCGILHNWKREKNG